MAIDAGKVVAMLELDTSAFSGGLNTARGMLKTFGDDTATATDKLRAVEKAAGTFGATLSAAVTLPLVAAGTAAVKTFTGFDDAMRQVRATMNATEEETAALTESAKRMGAETRYSASEAAGALNYLALAGYDAEQAIAALPAVLNLAQAGGLDLAYASDLATDSMSALGLGMDELVGFTDQLAVTSQKSNTSISQLGQAILTVGGTAKALRGGTAELNAELGILADSGIKGAEGGTHLRNVILSLQNPTEEGAKALARYTAGVYDAEGRLRSLDDIFSELEKSMSSMTDAERANTLNDLFNKTDLAAAQVLIAGAGERYRELTGSIEACDGAAQKMAETMEGGIGGAFRSLGSATEGLAIEFGENLAPFVQTAAERVADLTRDFTSLSESQQNTILTIGGLVAAGGPALLMLSKIAGAIASINPVVAGVTLGLAGLAAAVSYIREEADWAGRMDRKLNIGISDVELEQYRLPEEETDLGTQKAAFTLEVRNKGKSAYEQIKAIMNDGVPENEEDYATMAAGVNAVIDASMKALEDNYKQKAANIQALFDSGVLNKTEYEKQMADLKAKTEEQEKELTASAGAVTDYIKELIAANAPMTETQLAYLQQLIDKLVETSVAAGEATDAALAGYRLAYERVQSGRALPGDVELAAVWTEHQAEEKRNAIYAARDDKRAELGKRLESAEPGSAEYDAIVRESAEAERAAEKQLETVQAAENAQYAELLAGEYRRVGLDKETVDLVTRPDTSLRDEAAKADAAREIGEKDLTGVQALVGYYAANGSGEAVDLSDSGKVLAAANALLKKGTPKILDDTELMRLLTPAEMDQLGGLYDLPPELQPTDYADLEARIAEIFARAQEETSAAYSEAAGTPLDGIFETWAQKVEELGAAARESRDAMEDLYGGAEEAAQEAQAPIEDLLRPLTDEEIENLSKMAKLPAELAGKAASEAGDATAGAKTSLDALLADANEVFADLTKAPAGMTGEAWNGGYALGSSMGAGFSAGFSEHAVIPGIATNGTLSGGAGTGETGQRSGSGGSGGGGNTLNIIVKDAILRKEEDVRTLARKLGGYVGAVNFGKD